MMHATRKSAPPLPPLLFISYARVDDNRRQRLRIHLTPLVRGNVLRVFDDTELNRDVGWRNSSIKKLNEADLILLLVSADFIHSQFCFEEEWPIAYKRWKARKAIVTFALLGPCQWKSSNIGDLQGAPAHGQILPKERRGAEHFWDGLTDKLREDVAKLNHKKNRTRRKV